MPATGARGRTGHEFATLEALARRLARLHGYEYAGVGGAGRRRGESVYFVPEQTLLATRARALGIAGVDDLFGGVVPRAFVATKVVSHPLVDADAPAPAGWSRALSGCLADAVLPGFAVFSRRDARRACAQLLDLGPLRLKLARGTGGLGQVLVPDLATLEAALDDIDEGELARHGATVEQHLADATTCSIGTVECAGLRITYAGTQRTTPDRNGAAAYGGTDLLAVRGGFDALRGAGLAGHLQRAAAQAQCYHAAMREAYPGFFASRCNYDIVQGLDRDGQPRSGVLEQSWRIGGASPAEIAALEAFAADPRLQAVRASSHEVHGAHDPPAHAVVHYRDVDPTLGPLTKYSIVERHGHPT